ncbi:MAG: thioredoxin domain-containing protein [Fimbriiglobus sp.]
MRSLIVSSWCLVVLSAGLAADPPKPGAKKNRLAGEVSPYLLQHAYNPVEWHPWGSEALERAKKENKLIFLSIGYSSCHWCHVMERESFSNAEIAALMNKHFVCIKVDREERPDVDEAYMTALQALGESGGWPLSMFLTPDAKPIFGGTYWPPEDKVVDGDKYQGFKSVLNKVIEIDGKDRAGLQKQSDYVAKLAAKEIEKNASAKPLAELKPDLLSGISDAFEFDPEYGGFGMKLRAFKGTKFPKSPSLLFLIRYAAKTKDAALAKSLETTLRKMAQGGIFDQLGGGFHRYSTERTWTVPHFEKMLYDNGQLVELYALHARLTGSKEFHPTIRDTLTFIEREMTSPDGVFYSALDADSEGHEGRFYVWTAKQLDDLLGPAEKSQAVRGYFGFTEKPNFEKEYYIPVQAKPGTADAAIREAQTKLFTARAKRERPFLDTKILTGWNGLMIAGYAEASVALNEPKYLATAEKAADFLLKTMRNPQGRLLRIYAAKEGEKPSARGIAFLDDYSYLLHGLLNLHDATKNDKWLTEAKKLADAMIEHHGDTEKGGFYLSAKDAEQLFARGMDHYDGATPAGNSLAIRSLVRLSAKMGDKRCAFLAEKGIKRMAPILQELPSSAPLTADALDLWLTFREATKNP